MCTQTSIKSREAQVQSLALVLARRAQGSSRRADSLGQQRTWRRTRRNRAGGDAETDALLFTEVRWNSRRMVWNNGGRW